MKTEKLIWGLILVFIGGILLLNNFGVIDFYWGNIWHFWPLILILSGINLLFSKTNSVLAGTVAIVVTVGVLAFITYQGIGERRYSKNWSFRTDDDRSDKKMNSSWAKNAFTEPYVNTNQAELNISGGAATFTLEDTTADLFAADVRSSGGGYSLQKQLRDSMPVLDFGMRSGKHDIDFGDSHNEANMKLSTRPFWNINLKMGAGKAEFDLTPFKVSNLNIKGGAAAFDVKLGEPQSLTKVSAETGVANVKIAVPRSVGCRIVVNSGLSSKDFEDFTKQADGAFTTDNYNTASKKIEINFRGGLSEFEVERY